MEIRKLTQNDLEQYKEIRLEGLKNNPLFFGSSFEEEKAMNINLWLNKITENNDHCSFGLFVSNKLISLITLNFETREKRKHCINITSVITKQNFQNKGYASLLFKETLSYIDNFKKYTNLTLKVGETNINAIKLYKKFGFIETGKDINTIFYNNNYYSLITMQKIMH